MMRMMRCLAFLPVDRVIEGLGVVLGEMLADSEQQVGETHVHLVDDFRTYFQNSWLSYPSVIALWNVSDRADHRTNNDKEGSHNGFKKSLGVSIHSNFWLFLDRLRKLQLDQDILLNQMISGGKVRKRAKHVDHNEERISALGDSFTAGSISISEYLRSLVHHVGS
jgi:hypothetical protein